MMASGAAGASPLGWLYGGFWIRFGARFIDGLIFTVPTIILFAVFLMPNFMRAARQGGNPPGPPNPAFAVFGFLGFFVFSFLLGGCYEILMLRYRSATVGKMACGLIVVRFDGRT